MSSEQKQELTEEQRQQLGRLRNEPAIYVLMSACTKLPYIECDEETFDDEMFLYYREEDAKEAEKLRKEAGIPVYVTKIVQRFFLPFYSSLFPMGINCIVAGRGTDEEFAAQLTDLLNRPVAGTDEEGRPTDSKGRPVVENPEFFLTAIYFMQKLRTRPESQTDTEIQELQEEMMAHYAKGRYLVAIGDNKTLPILKQKDGKVLLPVFTDMQEFMKFQGMNKDIKLRTAVVEAAKIGDLVPKEASGVVVNPFSVNLQLQIRKKPAQGVPPQTVEQLVQQTIMEETKNETR